MRLLLFWTSNSSIFPKLRRPVGSSLTVLVTAWLAVASALAASAASACSLVGLRNLGNTCYLNAQLQCAYQIPLVRHIVLEEEEESNNASDSDDDDDDDNNDDKPSSSSSSSSPGLQALRSVFGDMMAAAGKASPRSSVSPIVLTRTLGIPVYEQQDSQEFWKLLLPALNQAALTDLYQGAFQDYIVAQDGSGRERRREETFLDISLNVPAAAEGSVETSLAETFGAPELLRVAEGNGWRPAKGADKVDALKGCRLLAAGLPAILQLHLKRFNYDWNRDVMEKSNVPFRFDHTLDLQPLLIQEDDGKKDDANSILYDLQGVVIHVGQYDVGHYYAYVRPNLDSDVWYRINDDVIDQVTWDDVLTDAIGGMVKRNARSSDDDDNNSSHPKRGLLGRVLGILGKKSSGAGSYGFGGSTSNAYVLQYVKRSERDRLYRV